jgi:tripartite ATP-independent transporter DctM subunit
MTEREIVGIVGFIVLFVLLLLRIPVGLTMVAVGIGGSYVLSLVAPHLRFEPYLRGFKTLLWNTVANYELSVVPLFVLMGFLAAHANLSRDLFQGVNALIGRLRGGVAMAAVGACASFGAVCGSSLATASTMGKVALPELKRMRYEGSFATGTLAAGGTLGILIPPSVPLVIYAIIVEASIIEMFQAAIVPGLIAVAGFILVIALLVRLRPERAPAGLPMQPDARRQALIRLIPVVAIFGAIILGLGMGLFTPTPAAGAGVFAILVYGLIMRLFGEGLTLQRIGLSLRDTAVTTSMIYFILFGRRGAEGLFRALGSADGARDLGERQRPRSLDGADRDAGDLHHSRLLHGIALHDPRDRAVLLAGPGRSQWRRLCARRQRRLRPLARRSEDLVRHPGAGGGRARPDHAAGRPERVHHLEPRPRYADGRHL